MLPTTLASPVLPKHTPSVSAKRTITLQVKRTYSGTPFIRVVPNLEWVKCHNDLTQVILVNASRVLPFDGVGRLTNCWEVTLPASLQKEETASILDYARKLAPSTIYAYLREVIALGESTVKNKRANALTTDGTIYPTYKERVNV